MSSSIPLKKSIIQNSTHHKKQYTNRILYLLPKLRGMLGSEGWFISGSFANPNILCPNDIDIFFENEDIFKKSGIRLSQISSYKHLTVDTENAQTYNITDILYLVQLIKKHFGTIEEIFNTFDLNICKYAITPDGELLEHPTVNDPIEIINLNSQSFRRVLSYLKRLPIADNYSDAKRIVNEYIGNSDLVSCYYTGKLEKIPANVLLQRAVKEDNLILKYFNKQAMEKAPELLL